MKRASFHVLNYITSRIIILILGSIIGVVALLLVFCIPTEKMIVHIQQSMPTLENEFASDEMINGYTATLKGNFTDCLMLENAVYVSENHSLFEQVLFMYRGENKTDGGWAPGISLKDYVSGKEMISEVEYSRYWHGYLVVLKPLLYFMNLNSIRLLASYLQFFLSGVLLMLFCRQQEYGLAVVYMFASAFLYSPFLSYSLSLSICFYLLCLILIIQLIYNDKMRNKNCYSFFFFFIGMATSYFDFLTYPLVTLGFPICIYLYLNTDTWRNGVRQLLTNSVEWGFGYIGFWAMKWIATSVFADGDTIGNAVSTILSRTDNAEGYSKIAGFITVLKKNIGAYTNQTFLLLIAVGLLLIGYLLVKKCKYRIEFNAINRMGIILLVALYPFIWFFVTQNHSDEHWMFTCKILSISVFAIGCAIAKFFGVNGSVEIVDDLGTVEKYLDSKITE